MFFAGVVLCAVGSADASAIVWAGGILALLLAQLSLRRQAVLTPSPLVIAVGAYAAWLVADDFLNSPYTSAAIFDPAYLMLGFLFARSLEAQERRRVLSVVLAGLAALAGWSLWQAASDQIRAHAYFETPNTLATVINLALAPLLVTIAFRERRRLLLALAALLVAALVSTLSRGGFLALGAAALIGAYFSRRQSLPADRVGLKRVGGVIACGIALGTAALQLPGWLAIRPAGELESLSDTLNGSLSARLELWRLAVSAIGEHPWLGIGYLGFNELFQANHVRVPSYAAQNFTYFVHNDYLQVLLELGLPALTALLAMTLTPFWMARKPIAEESERVCLVAVLCGLGTMAVHAVADFPFFIPVCLLLFGCLLGEADRLMRRTQVAQRSSRPVPRVAKICAAALLSVLFLPPAIAEGVVAYGDHSWRAGRAPSAAFAFELARRLQPRDWRYHWYAGQFWFDQTVQSRNPAAAHLADGAFAAAVRANPREPRPLLARLATQIRFGALLQHRESASTLRAWADHALALAPLHPGVRHDYDAALAKLKGRQ